MKRWSNPPKLSNITKPCNSVQSFVCLINHSKSSID
nr:MAG TPA_asm: hypothetical protein [Caudoviricetes sp.]